ncbi:MAG TPA: hypothetical protein VGM00_04295 [Bradyrhizobium sp.]|jgi:tetratricopeptide (TPR) repeat protein
MIFSDTKSFVAGDRVERRLAAILMADVASYSRLMHANEEATHARVTALLIHTVLPVIAEHGGRVIKNTGDGFLAEFASAVDAVRAAMQFQGGVSGQHLWAERFDKPVANLFDMQDEMVSRLANALDAELVEAEAQRAGRARHPDAMDLYFQGRACWNKGMTPEYLTQARDFCERALALDAENVEAMVCWAMVVATVAGSFASDDRASQLATAETILTRALSMAPRHAGAHLVLGAVLMFTNRAAQGIGQCERALALDHNLADAHGCIGMAKYFVGRAGETAALCFPRVAGKARRP